LTPTNSAPSLQPVTKEPAPCQLYPPAANGGPMRALPFRNPVVAGSGAARRAPGRGFSPSRPRAVCVVLLPPRMSFATVRRLAVRRVPARRPELASRRPFCSSHRLGSQVPQVRSLGSPRLAGALFGQRPNGHVDGASVRPGLDVATFEAYQEKYSIYL